MPRPLNDSPYLYGLHDPGGERTMADQNTFGWVLFTEALGSDPSNQGGRDYSPWAKQGYGIMARLNHGYAPAGTIPNASRYPQFAQRCANWVTHSPGCHIWIIGNEMNLAIERPGVQINGSGGIVSPGEVIVPGTYADCYRRCRAAIKAIAGHQNDQVIVGAVGPWNVQTTYPGNLSGDWVAYLSDVLKAIGASNCDGISIHAYTHGPDPKLIYTDTFMNPPFQHRHYDFRCYQDFMGAIPTEMRFLPVYLTETDQNDAWQNQNSGWVQRAYGEINWWNQQSENQPIRAVILYRWNDDDKYVIDGKQGVIDDFKQAMTQRYTWPARAPQPEPQLITFPETGHTAHGPFAAFYRQYGQEITGLPISEQYVAADSSLNTQDWQRLVMEEYPVGKIRLRPAGQQLQELLQQNGQLKNQLAQLQAQITELRTQNSALQTQVAQGTAENKQLQTQVAQLQAQIAQLQAEIAELEAERGTGGGVARPPMTDITQQLPRDPTRFVRRSDDDIKYIVINHTAAPASVGADRVAQAQRASWPGITSQYFVTGDGQIQQTEPLDVSVSGAQSWLYNGVNIYVAGTFTDSVPTDSQLDALARLVAWLLSRYGLDQSAVRGAREFFATQSPGQQWMSGKRWKEMLLQRVRTIQARAGVRQMRTVLAADLPAAAQAQPLSAPALSDITDKLPRSAGALKNRPVDQIKYLVFNHTAADPGVAVETVAAAHQKRWGAILYQYLIKGDGSILQTEPIDQVVDLAQPWIAQAINIALMGDFTSTVPTPAQVDAAAQLSAWLMQEFKIPATNLKGAGEMIATQSPGLQWLQGKMWKNNLLARITEITDRLPADANGTDQASLLQQLTTAQQKIADLQAQIQALQASQDGHVGMTPIAPPALQDITDQLPKHPTERYDTRARSQITHLAIHHSAAPANVSPQSIAAYHVSQGWPGIGYHFLVEADGTIYQVNHLETVCYNVYNNNRYLVGICVAGTFNDTIPTPLQIESLARLVAWLTQSLAIPLQSVVGHREYPENATECPGNEWLSGARWKDTLMARVRTLQAGSTAPHDRCIAHYLLFWQHPDDWASDDWAGALAYIARFRPTAGFSIDDARTAEYVTIVGGPAGVSLQAESALVAAGCKVERIAGQNAAETKQMLDQLASRGQRFRTFKI